MQSPWNCTEMVDRTGMPVNRAILVTDTPSRPIVALCGACNTQHRVTVGFPDHDDCSDECVYGGREATYCPTQA